MVVEVSSDSSSSSASSPVIPEEIREALQIRAFYRTPVNYIEPFDPSRAPRPITTFDPREMEAFSTSNQGLGPFANAPEEVRGHRRPVRPCPYQNQYFSGAPGAYGEFKRVYSIPPDVEVRLLLNTNPLRTSAPTGRVNLPPDGHH